MLTGRRRNAITIELLVGMLGLGWYPRATLGGLTGADDQGIGGPGVGSLDLHWPISRWPSAMES